MLALCLLQAIHLCILVILMSHASVLKMKMFQGLTHLGFDCDACQLFSNLAIVIFHVYRQ